MQGCGTRVFSAKRKDGKGSTVVVKDVWQDQDRLREGDTLQNIVDKIQEETDKKVKERNKRRFLSVICHGDTRIEGKTNDILDFITRSTPVPPNPESLDTFRLGHVPQHRPCSHQDGNERGECTTLNSELISFGGPSTRILSTIGRTTAQRFRKRVHPCMLCTTSKTFSERSWTLRAVNLVQYR